MLLYVLAALAVASSALELTAETYDGATAGKTVFIKFFAPWCGHCKKMKPDWDKLMAEYKDNPTTLLAEVDCTAGGKSICDSVGVQGYPTIKYGDPAALEDYDGARSFDALSSFAKELKPLCSPANLDLCDDADKAKIQDLLALSDEDLDSQIAEGDKKIKDADATFQTELKKLQDAYEQLQKDKENTINQVKSSGLGLLKAVKAHKAKANRDEL